MVILRKYVDHGRNGLHITTRNNEKLIDGELLVNLEFNGKEYDEIISGLKYILTIQPTCHDQEKKIVFNIQKVVKQLCEENSTLHIDTLRRVTLIKFFQPRFRTDFWDVDDKIDLFLKVCERMYNKTDYNFVISIKRKDGSENIRTFRDHSYIDYISNYNRKYNDSYLQVTIDNVKCYDPEVWVRKVEEMYYEVEDFAERLNTLIEGFLTTPGLLFKKLKNGIPFGLWLVSQFIDTGDDHIERIMVTKQKLGQMFFESSNMFAG